jgi:predicted AAA+ superfamily ATPase
LTYKIIGFSGTYGKSTRAPVAYFYDVGLRNYAVGLYGGLIYSSEAGFAFQNFVLNLLRERFLPGPAGIHFWRTKDKAEVDFAIDVVTGTIRGIEPCLYC